MPNGKLGDHPLTDILIYHRSVYSPVADALVREIAALASEADRKRLADLLLTEFNDFENPDVPKLESVLTDMRDRLRGK